jgi:hypothetical protein
VEGGWLLNDLKRRSVAPLVLDKTALVHDDFEFTKSGPCFYELHIREWSHRIF